jgi:hypothetical protein
LLYMYSTSEAAYGSIRRAAYDVCYL